MSMVRLSKECPGFAVLLGRYFDATTAEILAGDYFTAARNGGNLDERVVREEGVSFNPRVARIVTLLLRDGGVTDPWVVRVAMCSAVSFAAGALADFDPTLVAEAERLARDPLEGPAWYQTIVLACMLDRVRHLHMTDMSVSEREECLKGLERSPAVSDRGGDERLLDKVRHAIKLQRTRLSVESQAL
jgi:hypothetical protein